MGSPGRLFAKRVSTAQQVRENHILSQEEVVVDDEKSLLGKAHQEDQKSDMINLTLTSAPKQH